MWIAAGRGCRTHPCRRMEDLEAVPAASSSQTYKWSALHFLLDWSSQNLSRSMPRGIDPLPLCSTEGRLKLLVVACPHHRFPEHPKSGYIKFGGRATWQVDSTSIARRMASIRPSACREGREPVSTTSSFPHLPIRKP